LEFLEGLLWERESHIVGNYVSKKEMQLDLKSLKEFVDTEKLKKMLSKLTEVDKDKLSEKQQLALQLLLNDKK
jgi:hypothetical protein